MCGLVRESQGYSRYDGPGQRSRLLCSREPLLRCVSCHENGEDFPPERDIVGEEARIGVFVCDCGIDIGGLVDVGALVAGASSIPGVVVAESVGQRMQPGIRGAHSGHRSQKEAKSGSDRGLFAQDP